MPAPIVIAPGVRVPPGALRLRAARASGPGGQNVNKVASKVELRVDLDRIEGLTAAARERLTALAQGRLGAAGELVVTSQRTRDQHRNLEDAREKVRALVARALREPKRRRATRPTETARRRRKEGKQRQAARKRARRVAGPNDED